jgi:hypothetical protein
MNILEELDVWAQLRIWACKNMNVPEALDADRGKWTY